MNDFSFAENFSENYSLSAFNDYASQGVRQALKRFNSRNLSPLIICVGSDLVLGDSLGPLIGTMLKDKNVGAYVYGTLNFPITAKEVEYAKTYLKTMHPNSFAVAIDAAVGNEDDVGLIKTFDRGLKPGLGVNKNLGVIGDCSVIGVVSGKSAGNYGLFNLTRLNLIYKMAEKIAAGIYDFVRDYENLREIGA